ncbi:MAG: helix-hairpin-helix domain-containing protein [Desulfobacterales bacterium]|jgi:competence protein ComEA|nr:helix-hairpin-helix domain-containing protein [Desulfobacterales bacterium]
MRILQSRISLAILVVLAFAWFTAAWAEDLPRININTASADELAQLKGVGVKKAAVIIEYRETNGPFKLPEDFLKVPGIGPKTFETNKDRIVVE